MITRRVFLAAALAFFGFLGALPSSGQASEPPQKRTMITDVIGRSVEVMIPARTLILGEGRLLPTLAIVSPGDPTERVAGMMGDFKQLDPATYQQYLSAFPRLADIPIIGHGSAASFSSEKSITLKPDVAIFGMHGGHGPTAKTKEILDTLEAAGIPVVTIDFRFDPLVNTPKSIRLLGQILGTEQRADDFLRFYDQALSAVSGPVSALSEQQKPVVFLESRVGLGQQCCETMGNAILGKLIGPAGGRNYASPLLPGDVGTISLEQLLVHQPDAYLATAIGAPSLRSSAPNRIELGVGTSEQDALQSLGHALTRPGLAELNAVQKQRVMTIWHHFYNTPMHFAAIQALAKWLHPSLFADLDPQKTLAEFFERFQPVPLDGLYWAQQPGAVVAGAGAEG